jgi:hypothetical protein
MPSRVLCKAAWLNDPENEKLKDLDSKAQEKAFKESGHWQNTDKKVNFGSLFVRRGLTRESRKVWKRRSDKARAEAVRLLPFCNNNSDLLQLAKLGENSGTT